MSLELPSLEYGASCWDLYRGGQINALDRVQKKAANFANHTNDSDWETLVHHSNIAGIWGLFETYNGERAWKSRVDRLKVPCYQRRDDQHRKIRARKQRTGIGKYSFVNRTIKFWNQLPAEALATLSCKSRSFRERASEERRRVFVAWGWNIQKWREVKNG
jgi:hypothetical protein